MQAKIGTTEYSSVHNEIRKRAAEKRNERKRTIALQVRCPPLSSFVLQPPVTDSIACARTGYQRSRRRRETQISSRRAKEEPEEEESGSVRGPEGEVRRWFETKERIVGAFGAVVFLYRFQFSLLLLSVIAFIHLY